MVAHVLGQDDQQQRRERAAQALERIARQIRAGQLIGTIEFEPGTSSNTYQITLTTVEGSDARQQ